MLRTEIPVYLSSLRRNTTPEQECEWLGKRVEETQGRAIKIVGGEQDHSLPKWGWMMANGALQLVQPDIMYNGGILSTIHVANLALRYGLPVTTHNPRNNTEYANLLHLAAVLPNLGPFQAFRGEDAKSKIPFTPDIVCTGGTVKILTQPGLGIQYDPEFMAKAEVLAAIDKGG